MTDGQSHGGLATEMVIKEFMVKNGTCTTCDGKVQSAAVITCKLCNTHFHAVCPVSTKQNKICNETLLKNYNQNSTRDNFMWYCNSCLTMNEHNTRCSLNDKLSAILLKFDVLTTSLNTVKDEVANNTKAIENMAVTAGNSAAVTSSSSQKASDNCQLNSWNKPLNLYQEQNNTHNAKHEKRSRIVKKANTTILLKCSEEGDKPDLQQIKDIAVSYGIPVNRVNFTANSNAVISLPSTEARDKLKPLLAARPSLKKHAVSNLEAKLPAITVLDIREEIAHDEFLSMLKVQNPTIAALIDQGENFSDVTLTNKLVGHHTYTQVHATVSPKLCDEIKSGGDRLFIGLSSCRVVDKISMLRCYKCHNHGHVAKNCSEASCCGYCSSVDHESNNCELKRDIYRNKANLNCINCKRRKLNSSGHSVFWSLCPINKQFREKAKKSVSYYADNLNG